MNKLVAIGGAVSAALVAGFIGGLHIYTNLKQPSIDYDDHLKQMLAKLIRKYSTIFSNRMSTLSNGQAKIEISQITSKVEANARKQSKQLSEYMKCPLAKHKCIVNTINSTVDEATNLKLPSIFQPFIELNILQIVCMKIVLLRVRALILSVHLSLKDSIESVFKEYNIHILTEFSNKIILYASIAYYSCVQMVDVLEPFQLYSNIKPLISQFRNQEQSLIESPLENQVQVTQIYQSLAQKYEQINKINIVQSKLSELNIAMDSSDSNKMDELLQECEEREGMDDECECNEENDIRPCNIDDEEYMNRNFEEGFDEIEDDLDDDIDVDL